MSGVKCCTTLRPVGDERKAFADLLSAKEADLTQLQVDVSGGRVAWGDAVQQLLDMVKECALEARGTSPQIVPGSHDRGLRSSVHKLGIY